jgi:hypothetical protein
MAPRTNRSWLGLALAAGIAAAGCMTSANSQHGTTGDEGAKGTLAGTTTAGPSCPVEGLEECPPFAVSAVRLKLTSLANGATTRLSSDARGEFRILLRSGRYRVELVEAPGGVVTGDLPATVTIIEDEETRLDIRFDSGIR